MNLKNMTQIKFYRVETLPEVGEVGSLYFVHKDEGPKLYVSTSDGFEQYSDLFDRDFSTLSVDALANAGDGVVYFTPDTHLIIKDGVVYGYENLTGYATEQWVENKGYLTEHLDISGKVDVTDFEEAAFITAAALNTFNLNLAAKESDISLLLTQVLELKNLFSDLIVFYCQTLPDITSRIDTLELLVEYLKLNNNNTVNTSWFSVNLPNNLVWLSGYYPELGCMELPLYDFGNVYIIQADEYKTPSVFTFDGEVTSVEDVLTDDGIPKVWVPGSVKNVLIIPNNGLGLVKNLVYFEEGVEYVGTQYPILAVGNLYLPSSLKEIAFDDGGNITNLFYNGTKELLTNIYNTMPVISNMLYCNDYFYLYAEYGDPIWKPEEIPANEIWYKTYDGNPITLDIADLGLDELEVLGANILAHEYEDGKYIITCDGPVNVNINVFSDDSAEKLTWLGIPKCLEVPMDFYFWDILVLIINECPSYLSENLKIAYGKFVDINSTAIGLSYNSGTLEGGLILRNNDGVARLESGALEHNTCDVFVPKELVDYYKQDTNWCIHNIYAIPDQYYIK